MVVSFYSKAILFSIVGFAIIANRSRALITTDNFGNGFIFTFHGTARSATVSLAVFLAELFLCSLGGLDLATVDVDFFKVFFVVVVIDLGQSFAFVDHGQVEGILVLCRDFCFVQLTI